MNPTSRSLPAVTPATSWRYPQRLFARSCGYSALLVALTGLLSILLLPVHYTFFDSLDPDRAATLVTPMDAEVEGWVYSLPLQLFPPPHMGSLDRLEIEIATTSGQKSCQDNTINTLSITEAILAIEATDNNLCCHLAACPDKALKREDLLVLTPIGTDCQTLWQQQCKKNDKPNGLDAVLRIRLGAYGSIGLTTSESTIEPGRLAALDSNVAYRRVQGHLSWKPIPETGTRLELLAWLWDLDPSGYWIVITLCVATGLAILGVDLIVCKRHPSLAASCLALALATAYAVILPPFHAPDEPDHFLSFTILAERNDLFFAAFRLARHGHFDRLRFNAKERFLHADQKILDVTPWDNEVTPSTMAQRSWLTTKLWQVAIPLLRPFIPDTAAGWLLGLRLLHGLNFAIAVSLGVQILTRMTSLTTKTTTLWPLFLFAIPTLPFFAMHVSNYAMSTVIYLLIGCTNLALFLRRGDFPAAGLALGGLSILLILSGSSSLPLLIWLSTILAGRIFLKLGSRAEFNKRATSTLLFWGGLSTAIVGIYFFKDTPQMIKLLGQAMQVSSHFLPQPLTASLLHPITWALIILLAVLAELGLGQLTATLAMEQQLRLLRRVALYGIFVALSILLFFLALSTSLHFADSPNNIQNIPLARYLQEVTVALLTGLSFREPDTLLSETFWLGFSWHHAGQPKALAQWLAGGAGVGLSLTLWRVWREKDTRRATWLWFWITGTLGIGLTAAMAAHTLGFPNIHGRYLLGFYATLLSICGAGFTAWPGEHTGPRSSTTTALRLNSGLILCTTLHTSCLATICWRLFG